MGSSHGNSKYWVSYVNELKSNPKSESFFTDDKIDALNFAYSIERGYAKVFENKTNGYNAFVWVMDGEKISEQDYNDTIPKKYEIGGGVDEIKFEELVGNKFSIERGSGTKTTTWEKEDLLEEIKQVIIHELFDRDFYYNWTDKGAEYYNVFDKYTLTPMLKDIDKTLNEYFVMKKTPYDNVLEFKEHSKIKSIKELGQGYIDNWFKTNPHISPMLRNDYKKYREKYAGVTPYAKGGGVELSFADFSLTMYRVFRNGYKYEVEGYVTKNKIAYFVDEEEGSFARTGGYTVFVGDAKKMGGEWHVTDSDEIKPYESYNTIQEALEKAFKYKLEDDGDDNDFENGGVMKWKYTDEDELIEDAFSYFYEKTGIKLEISDFEKIKSYPTTDYYQLNSNSQKWLFNDTNIESQDTLDEIVKLTNRDRDYWNTITFKVNKDYLWGSSKLSLSLDTARKDKYGMSEQNLFIYPLYKNKYGDVKGGIGFKNGGNISDVIWQIKNSEGKYWSRSMSGKDQWFDSPDMGYTYTKSDADKILAMLEKLENKNLEVVKYDKDWYKKLEDGGLTYDDVWNKKILGLTKEQYIKEYEKNKENYIRGNHSPDFYKYAVGNFLSLNPIEHNFKYDKTNTPYFDYPIYIGNGYKFFWEIVDEEIYRKAFSVLVSFEKFDEYIELDFQFRTPGDDFEEYDEEALELIKILNNYFDFDRVSGLYNIDGEPDGEIDLSFYKNNKLIFSIRGLWNDENESYLCKLESDGKSVDLSLYGFYQQSYFPPSHPTTQKNIKKAVEELRKKGLEKGLKLYSAVIGQEGYEIYHEETYGLENAENLIQDLKENTTFSLVSGKVYEGDRIENENIIKNYKSGGKLPTTYTHEEFVKMAKEKGFKNLQEASDSLGYRWNGEKWIDKRNPPHKKIKYEKGGEFTNEFWRQVEIKIEKDEYNERKPYKVYYSVEEGDVLIELTGTLTPDLYDNYDYEFEVDYFANEEEERYYEEHYEEIESQILDKFYNMTFQKGGDVENKILIDVVTLSEHKHKILVNGRLWNKPKKDTTDLGDKIINVLFYVNRDGSKSITIMVDGKDETLQFKKDINNRYKNTGLKHFIDYLGKENYEDGGYIAEISKEEFETIIGRKLNGWNDDKVEHKGHIYQKCFLKPYYKIYEK